MSSFFVHNFNLTFLKVTFLIILFHAANFGCNCGDPQSEVCKWTALAYWIDGNWLSYGFLDIQVNALDLSMYQVLGSSFFRFYHLIEPIYMGHAWKYVFSQLSGVVEISLFFPGTSALEHTKLTLWRTFIIHLCPFTLELPTILGFQNLKEGKYL